SREVHVRGGQQRDRNPHLPARHARTEVQQRGRNRGEAERQREKAQVGGDGKEHKEIREHVHLDARLPLDSNAWRASVKEMFARRDKIFAKDDCPIVARADAPGFSPSATSTSSFLAAAREDRD